MREICLFLVACLAAACLGRLHVGLVGAEPGVAEAGADTTTIRGQVLGRTGPIENAAVGVKGHGERVRTDERGRFRLRSTQPAPVRLAAWKEGYFVAGADWPGHGEPVITLRAHPREDCTNYPWVDPSPDAEHPEQCGNCHEQIFREWSESAHATSITNRRFLNLYEGTDWDGNEDVGWSLLREYPEGSGVCWSCHAPSLEPDLAATQQLHKIDGAHRHGVHCDFCHKIVEVSVDHVGHDHGRFAIELLRPVPGRQIFFGSLDDDRGRSVYLPLYRESRYCASCHEGIVLGTHAYSEYSEWLASPYAKRGVECQDCHMAPTGRMTNIAPGCGGVDRDPLTLASHASSRANPQVLRSHLSLSLEGSESPHGIEVTAEVRVEGVGHRMPTGYPSRAVILWVRATTAGGEPLELREGPVLLPLAGDGPVAEGGLAGQPGKMYAKVLEGLDGQVPAPYWRVTRVKCDTRLMPDQVDRARFLFDRPDGEFTVVARLLYRRFSKYLADQKGWPDNEVLIATKRWPLPDAAAVDGPADRSGP
jgi:hypothetical protein